MEDSLELEKSKLKNQALLEKISAITTKYENEAADYRVEITLLAKQNELLQREVEEYRAREEPAETANDLNPE